MFTGLLVLLALAAERGPGAVAEAPRPIPAAPAVVPSALPSGGADFEGAMLAWSATEAAVPAEPLLLPTRMIRLSSGFGLRRDPIRGHARQHRGIDLPDPIGTPVRAAASGVVVFAGPARGYGNLVQIDHGAGGETRYAHLSAIAVMVGDVLRQGDTVGNVGSTGRSTGAHLHFEVRIDGTPLDPLASFDRPIGTGASHAATPVHRHWDGYAPGDDALPHSRLQ